MKIYHRLFAIFVLIIVSIFVFSIQPMAAEGPASGEQAGMAAESQADGAVKFSGDVTGSMKRADQVAPENEAARYFFKSLKTLILYITVIITGLIMMELLGILEPLQRVMSFQLIKIGNSPLSLWTILKAVLILLVFIYLSRFLCAYLDYRVYPATKVEPGLAYVINTFLKYFFVIVGALVSLQIVGFDLRALMVFAGAVGIGVGLAMQSVASNIISGFAIIFGGKIRKGDWIEISGTLGVVTDIYLRATKVRNRDNIDRAL